MTRSNFLFISGIASFAFGGMMFFIPSFAASLLGIEFSPGTTSLLHGMGGLIIGTGAMNFFARNFSDTQAIRAVLLTNIVTHVFGLLADVWGVLDGALEITKMAPVEITHLFVGVGSLVYLIKLKDLNAARRV